MNFAFILVIAILASCDSTSKLIKFPFSLKSVAIEKGEYACEAISDVSIAADTKGGFIVSKIQKGTDKIAINIDGDGIKFITAASVNIGISDVAKFKTISNTPEIIHYVDVSPNGNSLDSFTLNKKSGYAVWNKTRGRVLLNDKKYPETQSIYLVCR